MEPHLKLKNTTFSTEWIATKYLVNVEANYALKLFIFMSIVTHTFKVLKVT